MKTNNETHEGLTLDEKIALLLTEVRKITKHLKLDRRGKNDTDDPDEATDADESDKLLRELLEKVGDIANRKDFSAGQIAKLETMLNTLANTVSRRQGEHHNELKSALEKIGQALDEFKATKQDSTVHHRHSIDVVESKNFFFKLFILLIIGGLLYVVEYQRESIGRFRDNDLMYRYIRMKGEAEPKDILMLREVFEFHPNPDSIRSIRRQVMEYERIIQQQAETAAQAKLNAAEAERLKNQAETVKDGKK